MREKPLDGVRVLDLTRLLPGPVCTLHFADFGAEVIKVEDTAMGDYARNLGVAEGEMAPVFVAINRNKKSIALNLKVEKGKEILLQLIETADVLVEGFRPGVMKRLGLDYDVCREVNETIVYCSISGYGQNGPYRVKAGHDINYIGYAGVLDQIGQAGGGPVIPNLQIGDILGGALVPAMTILAALYEARWRGKGRYIDVSMTDAVLAHNYQALGALAREGDPGQRGAELLSGREACYGVYQTSEGLYLAVGALEKKFWETLCDALNREDLKKFHWTNKNMESTYAREELEKIFLGHSQKFWVDFFEQFDCCVTPVLSLDRALEDDQIKARDMVLNSEHPLMGATLQFSSPASISDFHTTVDHPAPKQGEHTQQILSELGYSPDNISDLGDTVKTA